jgi:hypothetical protein
MPQRMVLKLAVNVKLFSIEWWGIFVVNGAFELLLKTGNCLSNNDLP